MSNNGYYNWTEILTKYNDKKLFNAFTDKHSYPEKRDTAEKLLLERKIIKKNSEGKYVKEEVEKTHLYFVATNLKKESKEATIDKLISNGLNYETSKKIVDAYLSWKRKQNRMIKPWKYIAPIVGFLALIADAYYFDQIILGNIVIFSFLFFYFNSAPTKSNFKKIGFFKVFPN